MDRIYDAAVKFAVGDQRTLVSKRKEVFDKFNKMGIETAKILTFFEKEVMDEINAEELRQLIGIGTSIKEGIVSIDKAFSLDSTEESNTEDKIKNLLDHR